MTSEVIADTKYIVRFKYILYFLALWWWRWRAFQLDWDLVTQFIHCYFPDAQRHLILMCLSTLLCAGFPFIYSPICICVKTLHLTIVLSILPDSLRGPHPENRTRPPDPLSAVVRRRHLPVHLHREKLQAHARQTAARGAFQSHGQQRVGGDGQPGPPSAAVQHLDSQRRSV